MILLCGIPGDGPLDILSDTLEEMGKDFLFINQRHFQNYSLEYELTAGGISGVLRAGQTFYNIKDFTGIYSRFTHFGSIPEYLNNTSRTEREDCALLHHSLSLWFEITKAKMVNKRYSMLSNASKPYQMQLIAKYGFNVPETLITNNIADANYFWKSRKNVIFKSASGIRSIVKEAKEKDRERLFRIRYCPTMFQNKLSGGTNIRVHVLKDQVFATKINSAAIDYRYAHQDDEDMDLEPINLPDEISEKCITMTRGLGLVLSGIDLYQTFDNEYYCFEVNPSPGFSFYENSTGQKISYALAEYLD